jgi:hypothetical protein
LPVPLPAVMSLFSLLLSPLQPAPLWGRHDLRVTIRFRFRRFGGSPAETTTCLVLIYKTDLEIDQECRDYFTVNVNGQLYRLARLPMGWSLSPFHFCRLTETFVRHLRTADPESAPPLGQETRHCFKRKHWKGARVIPYVNDFVFFASSEAKALRVRHRLDRLLDRLGLIRHPTK